MRFRLVLCAVTLFAVAAAAVPTTAAWAKRRARATLETYTVFTAPGVPAGRLTFTIGNAVGGVDQTLTCFVGSLADDQGARLDLPVGKRVSVTWADDATPAASSFVVADLDDSPVLEIAARGAVEEPDSPPEATSVVTIDSDALYNVGLPITKILITQKFGQRKRFVINNLFDEPGELYVARFVPGIYSFQHFDRDGELVGPFEVLFLEGEQGVTTWIHLLHESAQCNIRLVDDPAIDAPPVSRVILTPLSTYARREVVNNPGTPWPSGSRLIFSAFPGRYRVDTYDAERNAIATLEIELGQGQNPEFSMFW